MIVTRGTMLRLAVNDEAGTGGKVKPRLTPSANHASLRPNVRS